MILEKETPMTIRLTSVVAPAGDLAAPAPRSRVPVLDWAHASRDCGAPLHASPDNKFDAGTYQIALIPIGIRQETAVLFSPQSDPMGLLMSLTWQDIPSQFNPHPSHPDRSHTQSVVEFGEVRVNFLTREVYRSGRLLNLTAMEFKTLKFLVANPFRVFSRDELLNEVWGYDNYPCTRTVDNRVMKLRQKLEADPVNPLHFKTVHGVGYRFVP